MCEESDCPYGLSKQCTYITSLQKWICTSCLRLLFNLPGGLNFIRSVGEGAFGIAILVYNIYTREEYVLKRFIKLKVAERRKGPTWWQMELHGTHLIKHIPRHINIVDMIGEVFEPSRHKPTPVAPVTHISFLFEYCDGGNAVTFLTKRVARDMQLLNQYEARSWCMQLVSGLQHLHSHDIVHRDLALRNIFISISKLSDQHKLILEDRAELHEKPETQQHRHQNQHQHQHQQHQTHMIYKIGDFGMTTKQGEPWQPITRVMHSAPELFRNEYNKEADVFALGIIFSELLLLQPISSKNYETCEELIAAHHELRNQIRRTLPQRYGSRVSKIILSMVHPHANFRPSIHKVKLELSSASACFLPDEKYQFYTIIFFIVLFILFVYIFVR